MMETELLNIIGRLLLGGAFVYAGFRNPQNTRALGALMTARGIPFAQCALVAGIAAQVGAGSMFAVGYYTQLSAAALAVFVFFATATFHNFWDYAPSPERAARINGCISNVALLGAFLLV
ncbi:MAG: DoxX family protein [Allorhizobium sp.]